MPSNNPNVKKNLKPFVKGDPRINRKGRPKHFDEFRALAIIVARETVKAKGEPVLVDGKPITVAELILRQWAQSSDPRKQAAFVEYAYGKVPQKTEVTGPNGGKIETKTEIEWV